MAAPLETPFDLHGPHDRPVRRRLVGKVGFDAITEAQAIEIVTTGLRQGAGGWVITPNVDVLQKATRDEELLELVEQADLVLADGMPIVWASRLAGRDLPERVAGSDLAPKLARRAARDGAAMMLVGGPPGAAESAAARLVADHPDLRIGSHCPPLGFEQSRERLQDLEAAVGALTPCICLVGLGFPKQERLCRQLAERFPDSWFISVGATIEFLAGLRPRAHPALRLAGLEWLHRLALEPRRLGPRYLRDDLPFAATLLTASWLEGRAHEGSRER